MFQDESYSALYEDLDAKSVFQIFKTDETIEPSLSSELSHSETDELKDANPVLGTRSWIQNQRKDPLLDMDGILRKKRIQQFQNRKSPTVRYQRRSSRKK